MPRRPKGMFRRGKSWYFRKQVNYKQIKISLGQDFNEACRKLRKILAGGLDPSTENLTISKVGDSWLETYIATARNPKGQKLARQRKSMYLDRYMGNRLLRAVTRDDLRSYRLWLEKNGFRGPLSPQSVRNILTDLRCMLYWAEDSGLIDRAPIPRKLLPKIQERPPDRLTDDEVEKLVVLPDPFGFVIRLGLGTGLRWGEMIRARADDIHDGIMLVSQTKSGKVRRIPLEHDPGLYSELRGRIGRFVPFTNQQWLTDYCRRETDIQHFHVHQLRHTFACRWLERRGRLESLQHILGHASITTTQRYARLTDAHVREEAERLGAQMG